MFERSPDRSGVQARAAQSTVGGGTEGRSKGVAIVSDDPRFGLTPLRITRKGGPVTIRLFTAWVPDHHAAGAMAALANRLSAFCEERYGELR